MLLPKYAIQKMYPRIRYYFKQRHWSERFWWIIAFGLSACLCATSIKNIWVKWNSDPVIMVFKDNRFFVNDIPFPTLTICPETKVLKEKFDLVSAYHALIEKSRNLTENEQTYMDTLVHICNFDFPETYRFRDKFINESIYTTIQEMGPLFNNTIKDCYWQSKKYECSDIFIPVVIGEGLCFAFNNFNWTDFFTDEMTTDIKLALNRPRISHWNLVHGYEDGIHKNEYPIRVFNARHEFGLKVTLELFERDLEHICRGSVPGFKIFLNTPGQTLKMARQFIRVPLSEEAHILIKPSITYTSSNLRHFSPKQRKCFFTDERQLRFFRTYTKINCHSECLANYTRIECGCTPFPMPRPKGEAICGVGSAACYKAAENNMYGEDMGAALKDQRAREFREKCQCRNLCTEIEYDASVDRAKINWMESMNSHKILIDNKKGIKSSTVLISFKDFRVRAMKRSSLYTYTDFLAICGGLLGLFLGVSALSIIQFIYCSLLRLFCMLRSLKSKNTVQPFKRSYVISRISIEALNSQRNNSRI